MPVEITETDEAFHEIELGCLLVPVVMRLFLCDEMGKMSGWGEDIHWMRLMLEAINRYSSDDLISVMRVVLAGMKRVEGKKYDRLENLVNMNNGRLDPTRLLRWRRHVLGLAVKTTVRMVGGKQDYAENLEMVRTLSDYPEIVDELLIQMGVVVTKKEKEKLVDLLEKIL